MLYECICIDLIQQSEWVFQDVGALLAADVRSSELSAMCTADSRQTMVVPCLPQSQTRKWIDTMDGAPAAGGKVMMADVKKIPQSRPMPRLPPSQEGWVIPYPPPLPRIQRTPEAIEESKKNIVGGRLFGWLQRDALSLGERPLSTEHSIKPCMPRMMA